MDLFLIVVRFVHFAAAIVIFGASLFRIYTDASFPRKLKNELDSRLRIVLIVTSIVSLISAVAWWDALAVFMADDWGDALNVETLRTVLTDTEFGKIWVWHLALCAAIPPLLVLLSPNQKSYALVALLALGTLASLAKVGHSAMHEGPERLVHQTVLAVHLLAAGAWLGALAPLGLILIRARKIQAWIPVAISTLPKFSLAGYFAVILILLSGCLMSWHMVGSLSNLFGSDYGRVLIAKVTLFLLMTFFAIVNRFSLMPKIRFASLKRKRLALHSLGRNVSFEQLFGLAILIAASVLGTLQP